MLRLLGQRVRCMIWFTFGEPEPVSFLLHYEPLTDGRADGRHSFLHCLSPSSTASSYRHSGPSSIFKLFQVVCTDKQEYRHCDKKLARALLAHFHALVLRLPVRLSSHTTDVVNRLRPSQVGNTHCYSLFTAHEATWTIGHLAMVSWFSTCDRGNRQLADGRTATNAYLVLKAGGSNTIRYDTILCILRAVESWLLANLVHHTGQTEKLMGKKRTKNKSRSMISPVRSSDREGSPGWKKC